MDVSPDALYQSLLKDLGSQIDVSLLKLYVSRKDLPVGCSSKEAACISIARSFLKKLRFKSNELRDSVALLKFLEVNNRCSRWNLVLRNSHEEELYGELKNFLWKFWNHEGYPLVSHIYEILDQGRVGPGAAVMARGNDFYTKLFDSPLALTDQNLYFWYKRYTTQFPDWICGEKSRSEQYGESIVAGSRLSFVPKNDETSRCICIEPSLNMFYQLGLGQIIERRLSRMYGIQLVDQQFKNRELARRGSLDDSLATIDLESASDSMSLNMLRSVLPPDMFAWLCKFRSKFCDIPGLGYTELDMISSMGNGYTFPLQTVIFSSVVAACFKVRGLKILYPRSGWGNFGVNGDDIVVPREIVGDVIRLLEILGFVPNRSKTFVEGPFRESCGGDYYNGRNIRGVYVKSLDTEQDRYSVINQLNLFSTRTGLVLRHTVRHLLNSVRWLPVPRWSSPDSGIRLPFSLVNQPVSKRYQSVLYDYWAPQEKKIRIYESAIVVPKRCKRRMYNPNGLYIAFLQGAINSFSIGVRHDTVVYRRKRGVAPNWDTPEATHPLTGWFPDERWNTAVYLNL